MIVSINKRKKQQSIPLDKAFFLIVMLTACFLRFYRLSVPTLWTDELLALNNVMQPISYIFDLSAHYEIHPPYYYLFNKLLFFFPGSEILLRLPSAVAGILAVYAIYVLVKENFNRTAAMFSAIFLSTNVYSIKLSRQIRPYAILTLLTILSIFYLLRFLKRRSSHDLIVLCVINLAMLMTHYLAFLVVAAEIVIIIVFCLVNKIKPTKSQIIIASLGLFACLLFIGPFLFPSMLRSSSIIHSTYGLNFDLLRNIFNYFPDIISPFSSQAPVVIIIFLMVLGIMKGLYAFRIPTIVSLFIVLIAFSIMMVMSRQGSCMPWHIYYVVPILSVLFGLGVDMLIPGPKAKSACSVFVLGAGIAGALLLGWPQLYEPDSLLAKPHETITYRKLLSNLEALRGKDGFLVTDGGGLQTHFSRYAEFLGIRDVFREQEILPSELVLHLHAFCLYDARFNSQPWIGRKPLTVLVQDGAAWRSWAIERYPERRVQKIPSLFETDENLFQFLKYVYSMKGLAVDFNSEIYPAVLLKEGWFEQVFLIDEGATPKKVKIFAAYINSGEGNVFNIKAGFDGVASHDLFTSNGPDPNNGVERTIDLPAGVKKLTLRISMRSSGKTPAYSSPTSSVSFTGMECLFE